MITLGDYVLTPGGGVNFVTHEDGHWVLKGLDMEKYKDTFLRGVTIGDNVIIGARSLVNKSLSANSVYAGVPAKRICSLEEWEQKFMADMPEFDLENYRKNKKGEVLKIVDKFSPR